MTAPLIVGPRDGQPLDIFGNGFTVKATSVTTNAAYSLIEGAFEVGGFAPLPHIHREEDESFYVLEGEFDFRLGDDTVRATEGSFVLVPRGTPHSFVNAGDRPGRLLFIHSPPLEGFFVALAKLAASGPPNAESLGALMREWGMEVVGP